MEKYYQQSKNIIETINKDKSNEDTIEKIEELLKKIEEEIFPLVEELKSKIKYEYEYVNKMDDYEENEIIDSDSRIQKDFEAREREKKEREKIEIEKKRKRRIDESL